MAESWDPRQLSAILESSLPGLNKAEHDSAFPSLSPADADNIRTTSPLSTEGRVLRIFQDLLDHNVSVQKAADDLGSLISRHCVVENCEPALLWGAICHRAETWPEAQIATLCDLVVELAKLPHALPSYQYDTDEPVQGTSSFAELPGFGHELVGHMQGQAKHSCGSPLSSHVDNTRSGPKCYALRFMTPQARNDPSARSSPTMTGATVSGQVVVAIRNLYRNINTFAATSSRHHIQGSLPPQYADNRGIACYPIVGALENEISDNEIIEHIDGSTFMPEQGWTAFTRAQPSIELPAATQWLSVLGHDLYDGIAGRVHPAGPLWKIAEGNDQITAERWSFWQHRLRALAREDAGLGSGTAELCRRAADRRDRIT